MAAAGRSSLEELELTGEEVSRLREAFRDEGFRRLFAEYAAELADPAQRAAYEAEVVALERQRGVEARFLHPAPGWALRTSQAGRRRCYLNVCGSPLVGRPEARREPGGARWWLPHCLSPGREELGRGPGASPRRLVYDVVFHPDALRLAARSPRFRRLVDETALEAVERRFSPGLDRANAVPLRGTKYKGVPQATLLRTPLPGGAPPEEGGAGEEGDSPLPPFPTPYAYPPPAPVPSPPGIEPAAAAPTTPRWTLRQRHHVDLLDYRCSRDSAPSPVPRELEVAVELPLLSSAAQARLEVRGRELRLDSRRPAAAYRLRLPLPYPVDEDGGRAVFDKSRRRLVVTLPVRAREEGQGPGREQQEEDHPPASGRSLSSPAEQPGPLAHVAANHVQLPACAEESGPAADRGGEGATAAEATPGPLAGHLGSALEPLGDPATAAPGAADSHLCDRSPDARASEGGSGGGDKGHEAGPIPLDPQLCVGQSLELPVCGSITSPPPPPPGTEVGPCATMDLEKCPAVTDVVPSPELGDANIPATGDATTPATHLCGVDSNQPLTVTCQNSSTPERGVETCTSTDVSGYAGSCSNSVVLASSNAAPVVDLSVTTDGFTNSLPRSPLLSRTGVVVDPKSAINSSSSPDSPEPPSSPAPPLLCPPFQCTQDEEALTLLLQVPDIDPHSLKGEVDTNHYRVSFVSKDSASYTLLLHFPPENKLTSPETGISVSLNNAVIHLRKAPETAGLWTKLYFGLNEDSLQEKLFVSEDNVAGFLDSLQRPFCTSQPETQPQPFIEVLDVSEDKCQIQLKAQEHGSPEAGEAEKKVNPGAKDGEHPSDAENHPLVPDLAGEHGMRATKASNSVAAAETKEPAGWRHHCLEPDPADSCLAAPGKSQITKLQESGLAFTTDPRAAPTEQMQLGGGGHAGTGADVRSGSAESRSLAAPILRETDTRDGSVRIISHHATHCAVSFQNSLLYELD